MKSGNILYVNSRKKWRKWLGENFESEKDIWRLYPNRTSGKYCIAYNDAVEEALCFGWIDSIKKKHNDVSSKQRFTPRRTKSPYSQLNKERMKQMLSDNKIHPLLFGKAKKIAEETFVFPPDIITRLKKNKKAWEYLRNTSEAYKRIRIGHINIIRKIPEKFEKRLCNLIKKSEEGKKYQLTEQRNIINVPRGTNKK